MTVSLDRRFNGAVEEVEAGSIVRKVDTGQMTNVVVLAKHRKYRSSRFIPVNA